MSVMIMETAMSCGTISLALKKGSREGTTEHSLENIITPVVAIHQNP